MKSQIHELASFKIKVVSKTMIKTLTLAILLIATIKGGAQTNTKPTAAVMGIDSKGVIQDAASVAYMVRLELEKTATYSIMDKYDVADIVKKNNIDVANCMSKTCVVSAGKALGVEKMITGSIERFGEKIVITLKVIDVRSETVEKMNTTEYLNLQPELQRMIGVSVKKLLGIEPEKELVDMLVNYDAPVESPNTKLRLNGPRMGGSMAFGDAGRVLTAPKSQGGYEMYPATFQFGWQQEKQYLSAGNFQALIEFVGLVGGLESGKFIPSVTLLQGFRMGKGGWEFGFGPSFRVINKATGFYGDGKNGTTDGQWYLSRDWSNIKDSTSSNEIPYTQLSRLDSRGAATLTTSLIISAGKTFHSGYLNIPVNLYISPRKEGTVVGFSFGFNIYKKPKDE